MATYRQRTTPGVYITELDAFPNSVVGVQTAVPAFIGYTEKAEISGKPIFFTPTKIASMADFEQIFGGGFHANYNIVPVPPQHLHQLDAAATENPAADNYDFACREPGSDPSAEWEMHYYNLTRIDVPYSLPNSFGSEIEGMTMVGDGDDETPTVATLPEFNLYNALRLFYANGGGTCYIVSVGPYRDDVGMPVQISYAALNKGLEAIAEQSGPTMLAIPDAVLLDASQSAQFYTLYSNMLKQCADLQDRVAIFDVYGADALNQHTPNLQQRIDALVSNFQEKIGEKYLNYGMAYFPFLVTSIVQPSEISYTNLNLRDATQLHQIQHILNSQAELIFKDNPAQLATVEGYIEQMADVDPTKPDQVAFAERNNQNLVNAIPLLKQIENILAMKMSLMPPSAVMPGVYTYNDGTRGVWNAPANITLTSVIEPNVKLNNAQQGQLNVPLNGKAINVIRQFVGRGPVVWGARTLDGNSLDWRYIQVRRTLIYIEQSIEQALQPFVFAPNDGKTWVAVTSMISNFLQGLWSQGGLMGDKADDAFTVSCGLGSTMTPLDILDGYMIVSVTLQMIRPAEFIELTFKQKMQGM